MSIGINNQTIAYVSLTSTAKQSTEKNNDKFKSAVEKAEKKELSYNVASNARKNTPSAVDDYKKKHPEQAGHISKQVASGLKAKELYGVSGVNTEEMSMDEYKEYIADILGKIPFDASHPYDEEVTYISDEGWQQMKNDPDYEAWVLGYTVENRAVKNPFAGMGDKGVYCIEHFGASIEEHHGEGYSKVYGGTARGARSMFESAASGKGAIRNHAPRASEQPPKDWSLEEEQRKSKRQKKDFWDEIFESQLNYRKQLRERLNREFLDGKRTEHYRMMSELSNSRIMGAASV